MQLDSLETLFSNTWRRYTDRFSVLITVFLVPAVILCMGQLLLMRGTILALAMSGLMNLLGFVVSIVATIALVAAVGRGTDFAGSYRKGIALFWGSLWVGILVSAAVFGGFVMLIIPGIMLTIQLALASYVFVVEEERGINALVLSREYIKGHWWAFVGRILLFVLAFGVVMLVVYLPLKLLLGGYIGSILYYAATLFITPLSVCYIYEIYDNLRRLKPDAAKEAAKGKREFLIISMILGVAAAIIGFVLLVLAAAFIPGIFTRGQWNQASPNSYEYSYPPSNATTSTVQGEGGQMATGTAPINP